MGDSKTPSDVVYDVLIVGGGPAGLSTAVTLARQGHTTVIFDSGTYRNEASKHMHNIATWDHRDPADFRASAREDALQHYSTNTYRKADIASVKRLSDDEEGDQTPEANKLFQLTEAGTGLTWTGRKLLLAIGVDNDFPDLPGYAECWGQGIYHCLFCHGHEERGGRGVSAGVLAVQQCAAAPPACHMARNAAQLVPEVTIYTDGNEELATQIRAVLEGGEKAQKEKKERDGEQKFGGTGLSTSFKVEARKIARLARGSKGVDVVITFTDGSEQIEAFLAHSPKTHVKGSLAQQLGLELAPSGDIKVTPPFQQTSVRGVFAAGDCQTPFKVVASAMASGGMAAAGIAAQIQAEKHGHPGMF